MTLRNLFLFSSLYKMSKQIKHTMPLKKKKSIYLWFWKCKSFFLFACLNATAGCRRVGTSELWKLPISCQRGAFKVIFLPCGLVGAFSSLMPVVSGLGTHLCLLVWALPEGLGFLVFIPPAPRGASWWLISNEFGAGAAALALISTVRWFGLCCCFWLKNCSLAGGGEKQSESRCCSKQGGGMQALQFLSFLCNGFSSPHVRTKAASGPGSPHLNSSSRGCCHACVQGCCSLIRLY